MLTLILSLNKVRGYIFFLCFFLCPSALKVAALFGASRACSVRRPLSLAGAAACHSWTAVVWCPAYSAPPSESATASL